MVASGEREFPYAIPGRLYPRMPFAFPELGRGDEPRICRGEIVGRGAERQEHGVQELTREGIIHDFLDEHAKWKGW